MANFFVQQEGGLAINIEATYDLRVIEPKPLFVEQPKELFSRSWADEDGDDVYIPASRKMESRTVELVVYCTGDDYFQNYINFTTLLSEGGFDYWDVEKGVKVECVMIEQEVTAYNQIDKHLTGKITILNNTGRNESI